MSARLACLAVGIVLAVVGTMLIRSVMGDATNLLMMGIWAMIAAHSIVVLGIRGGRP